MLAASTGAPPGDLGAHASNTGTSAANYPEPARELMCLYAVVDVVNLDHDTDPDHATATPTPKPFDEHSLELPQLAQRYSSSHVNLDNIASSSGLTSGEANQLLETNGLNRLTPPKPVSLWKLYFEQVRYHTRLDHDSTCLIDCGHSEA